MGAGHTLSSSALGPGSFCRCYARFCVDEPRLLLGLSVRLVPLPLHGGGEFNQAGVGVGTAWLSTRFQGNRFLSSNLAAASSSTSYLALLPLGQGHLGPCCESRWFLSQVFPPPCLPSTEKEVEEGQPKPFGGPIPSSSPSRSSSCRWQHLWSTLVGGCS